MKHPDTLPARVFAFAARHPHKTALRQKQLGIWQELSWQSYADSIAACARALWELGVRAGDHVAILADNRPEWLFADLGAQAIGARGVGIYQTNPPADVAYILNDSQAKVLFLADQEQVDKAVACQDTTPSVTHWVVFDPRGTRSLNEPRLVSWDAFRARGQELLAGDTDWMNKQLAARRPEDAAMIVYTSGTTGHPKGAMLSSRNVTIPARSAVRLLGIEAGDSVLSYLPLCHVAEKIFTLFLPLETGCVVHFGESIETVQADLGEVSPTVFLGVPRIWEKMNATVTVKMRDASWLKRTLYTFFGAHGQRIGKKRLESQLGWWDRLLWCLGDRLVFRPLKERLGLGRCRVAVSGAAPIGVELLTWFHGVGVPIMEAYGQTECAGGCHFNYPGHAKLGSVGTTLPGVECRLGDDGEVLVSGANVFVGYLNNPAATAETVDADGWLHTGDIGTIDDEGFLRITGRKKEIIITSGGKNLSPERIENALKVSPFVKEAVAVGDGRNFISALVQIEYENASDFATRKNIAHTSYADLVSKKEIQELVQAEIHKANDLLAHVEQVRAFRMFPKELHQDDNELTPTQKVRRAHIHRVYHDLIESMYKR